MCVLHELLSVLNFARTRSCMCCWVCVCVWGRGRGVTQAQGEQACQVGCTFIIDTTGGHIEGDIGLYLGDLEVYRRDPGKRALPKPVAYGNELRAVVFREAESKFPANAWSKYHVNITYSLGAHVPYGYLDDFRLFLEAAAFSVTRPEHRPDMVGAVVLRCGQRGGGGGGKPPRQGGGGGGAEEKLEKNFSNWVKKKK